MRREEQMLITHDGEQIFVIKWLTGETVEPKAIIQLSHGMAEHSERYATFAKFLVDQGYVVYANDHRGHGKTAGTVENCGFFAEVNGWSKVVEDLHQVSLLAKKEYPGLPLFLLGHSMGSFLARTYIQFYAQELRGVILSGTGGHNGLILKLGKWVARMEKRRIGSRGRSKLLDKLSFGTYNQKIAPKRTDFDWLCRDTQVVDDYMADPFCGVVCTPSFFFDLYGGIEQIQQKDHMYKIPKDLSILLFAGDQDPVGNYGKGVRQIFQSYQHAGIKDVQLKIYEGGRHEMLNEMNKEDVFSDIVRWLDQRI